MASVVAAGVIGAAANAGAAYSAGAAFLITAGAAIIDSAVIMPALAGDPEDQVRPNRLADVPVGSNDAGAPRIWACGQRVRIPTHILWQDDKVLEGSSSSGSFLKKGADIPWRRTYFDCALALNDRRTERVVQLIGNGKLLVWEDSKTVFARSGSMSITPEVGTSIYLKMADSLDPDFTDKFSAGDYVKLENFIVETGGDPNEGWWRVNTVSPHGSIPSQMILIPVSGQTGAGMTAASGQFPIARVARADDTCFTQESIVIFGMPSSGPPNVTIPVPITLVDRTLTVGSIVELRGYESNQIPGFELFPGWMWEVRFIQGSNVPGHYNLVLSATVYPPLAGAVGGPLGLLSTHVGTLHLVSRSSVGFFPPTFVPSDHFRPGDDDQEPLPLMVDRLGISRTSAYRGVAVQGIDDFFVNDFGNQLPFSLEGIIDIDTAMTWPQAFEAVCLDRAGIRTSALDTSGVDARPFEGFYIRGGGGAGVAIQPLLIAGRVVTQERNGILAFFEVKNADVVQIENGASLSHLGARLASDPEEDVKVTREEAAIQELSTSVSVRHQDPDNNYADGYQSFGLRAPVGVEHRKDTPVNLNTMVLSRRKARELAATLLRQEWVNSVRYTLTLPICYYHLLENDVITFTDDDGVDIVARIVMRDVGANFLVRLVCVEEVLDIGDAGSAVQPLSLSGPAFPMPMPSEGEVYALQLAALDDDHSAGPGVYLGAAQNSPRWAPVTIYESADGVGEWVPVASRSEPTIAGVTVEQWSVDPNAAPSGSRWTDGIPGPDSIGFGDDPNILLPWGSLTPATEAEVDQGANWAAVYDEVSGEWEVIGFTEAEQSEVNPSVWRIRVARRGLRGTWPASMNVKPAGAKFVLLSTTVFHSFVGNRGASSMSYRAVYENGIINEGPAVGIAIKNTNSTPGPVRSVTRIDNSPESGDITFTIDLRGLRTNEPETSLEDSPMRETGEKFVVEIFDPTGVRIVRRKTLNFEGSGLSLLRDRKVIYTAAEQVEDNYSLLAPVYLSVKQVGEYGDGAAAKVLIS